MDRHGNQSDQRAAASPGRPAGPEDLGPAHGGVPELAAVGRPQRGLHVHLFFATCREVTHAWLSKRATVFDDALLDLHRLDAGGAFDNGSRTGRARLAGPTRRRNLHRLPERRDSSLTAPISRPG